MSITPSAPQKVAPKDDPHGWKQERIDLMRAITGGAIVGMPLLFTMEMWWRGMTLSEERLLALLGFTLAINFAFSLVSGFRERWSFGEAVSESVTATGIGIVLSILILWAIGELDGSMAPRAMIGKILVEAAVVSVGVSFANSQVLGKSRVGDSHSENGPGGQQEPKPTDLSRAQWSADLQDAGATAAGALVFALNIAPTEEVIRIATRLTAGHLLVLLLTSVLLCYIILFASGFEEHRVHVPGPLQHPVAETMLTCSISLGIAFALLWLVGPPEALASPSTATASMVTLGLPAIVGGAAGRLIV